MEFFRIPQSKGMLFKKKEAYREKIGRIFAYRGSFALGLADQSEEDRIRWGADSRLYKGDGRRCHVFSGNLMRIMDKARGIQEEGFSF